MLSMYVQKPAVKFPSLVIFYTHARLGEYLEYPGKLRWMFHYQEVLSQSQLFPQINSSAHSMHCVVKYGEGLIPIIHLLYLSQYTDAFDE